MKSPFDEVLFFSDTDVAFSSFDSLRAPFTIVMDEVIADKFVVIMVPAKAANTCNNFFYFTRIEYIRIFFRFRNAFGRYFLYGAKSPKYVFEVVVVGVYTYRSTCVHLMAQIMFFFVFLFSCF